jgi:hypothetical protein
MIGYLARLCQGAESQGLWATARSQRRRISAEKGPTTSQYMRKPRSTSATRVSAMSHEPTGGWGTASKTMATRCRRRRPAATAVVDVCSTISGPSTSMANRSRGRSRPRRPRGETGCTRASQGWRGARARVGVPLRAACLEVRSRGPRSHRTAGGDDRGFAHEESTRCPPRTGGSLRIEASKLLTRSSKCRFRARWVFVDARDRV